MAKEETTDMTIEVSYQNTDTLMADVQEMINQGMSAEAIESLQEFRQFLAERNDERILVRGY